MMGTQKIYGPFWPYNKRGLPIVLKNGIPAWMVVADKAERQANERKRNER
jgi:hypothetical protein